MIAMTAIADTPWTWEPRPDVWLLIAAIAVGYWWAITKLRPKLADRPPPPTRSSRVKFAVGVATLWVAVDWPMDRLGDDYLFSIHTAQFLLITMAAAPLLVAGVPTWLQVELVRPIHRLVRFLARGPVALVLFQAVLVGTHMPSVVALYTSNSLVHFTLHGLWILSGCIFWLPILGAEPVVKPLKAPLNMVYLIGATIVPTVPASFLTWTETALYESYDSAPRLWGISPVEDLQIAGALMKLGGGAILWAFILVLFVSWASAETAARPPTVPAGPTEVAGQGPETIPSPGST